MNDTKKLSQVKQITGKITLLSGLHIGMGSQEIHIGGIENPVVRHPLSHEPYIPGSSLKGKMRTLLEYNQDGISNDGKPYCPATDPQNKELTEDEKEKLVLNHPISRIFGSSETKYPSGPTRLTVRDGFLHPDFKKFMDDNNLTVADLFEGKWETAIDRRSGTARDRSLRQSERVIAGTEFTLNMVYKIFDEADDKNFALIEKALKTLLPNDALGGSGSRGYGRIKIEYNVSQHSIK